MILIAAVSLVLGVACGRWLFSPEAAQAVERLSEPALWLLMFSVGISVGGSREIFHKIRQYHVKVLLIPAGVVVGSCLAGALCARLCGLPLGAAMAVTGGLGWYSLAGAMVGELAGPEAGSVAFLSNLMREMASFALIPFLVKHLNPYTAIAPAAATSEDTTLPMMIKYTSGDVVIMSVVNGVICSAAAPLLMNLFCRLL